MGSSGSNRCDVIERAISASNSGPQVLEKIFRLSTTSVPVLEELKISDLVAVGSWYIWWIRRRQTHGEQVPLFSIVSTQLGLLRRMHEDHYPE
jgi:hypothetical protein